MYQDYDTSILLKMTIFPLKMTTMSLSLQFLIRYISESRKSYEQSMDLKNVSIFLKVDIDKGREHLLFIGR